MYAVDERDTVRAFDGAPAHSAGAPEPILMADGAGLVLAYETAPQGDEVAVLKFARPRAHIFGPPGEETWTAHPLAGRGLRPYGIFEVADSSWVRTLERIGRGHRRHVPARFASLRHLIFTFHDRTFECVAEGVNVVALVPNDAQAGADVLRRLGNALREV